MKLFDNKADIVKAIASIERRGKQLDKDIWACAVSAMAHSAQHHEVSLINQLVNAMPKGSRVNALKEYIMTFGKVGYDEENKCFTHDKQGEFDLKGAMGICWTEFKPEPEYKPLDLNVMLGQLIKKADKAMKENKGELIDHEQLAALKNLVRMDGDKAAKSEPVSTKPVTMEDA